MKMKKIENYLKELFLKKSSVFNKYCFNVLSTKHILFMRTKIINYYFFLQNTLVKCHTNKMCISEMSYKQNAQFNFLIFFIVNFVVYLKIFYINIEL